MTNSNKHNLLKNLPGVDHLLELAKKDDQLMDIPRTVILDSIRKALDRTRKDILSENIEHPITDETILDEAGILAQDKIKPRLVHVINATGVVLHTNLGRALLCDAALKNIKTIAQSYSNLELKIETGKRGIRYEAVDELICELTGAQSAIVVNNNAGAVLLALNTIAKDRQVVVSRGELVEIGGSFRVPDVMSKSRCILKEVGTTNRTHLKDYESAVSDETGLFLKVHASNYKIEGFTASVALKDLVLLGKEKNIPVMEDLGSGTLIDFSKYGLPPEPTVSDSVGSGADVVTFSGDKLLGGPQTGIIVGKKHIIDQIKRNPLTRALRIDKLTLAALESTLSLYRDEKKAIRQIPTLRMLTLPFKEISKKADLLFKTIKKDIGMLADIDVADMNSRPGGGSFPALNLPTRCITIQPKDMSVSKLELHMRLSTPAVIARIEDNKYILDPRTIQNGQEAIISSNLTKILKKK
ncbi:L-seryl-tRNA(Sec) selenium transferase [Desulfobacula phenolica]|uniref:L-seryl-tRNA(Sec) selenium transferase n=1 Tax=Desulfobacula phenolica TaxID=90732 RepID=A0A1H2F8F6_9BACT|nr:L-seryl-tRNA(Sec) selenium transferase [Desulfobacula phenolica]SDU03612.1 L-seryl-tRNA(Sec) selenium transferase [Desulfobacula phenolica]